MADGGGASLETLATASAATWRAIVEGESFRMMFAKAAY
jgi:hypothetical protein